ncbi:unnamed protein product [Vitrella brassicaformis CCMP3155]|uniref:Uncharacterized protein n=1 Tax=Vitrella brassicaformis (strain CCMP3155) TaxID=1169540 RepID=A0A0G4EVF7_VITBC|nr:unnamed protein product [Vitrella brassicaformis CCMP3155]|eukprot:CEM02611.1 unnamed protein product [Vitrella brassicaformis CCMP3155]
MGNLLQPKFKTAVAHSDKETCWRVMNQLWRLSEDACDPCMLSTQQVDVLAAMLDEDGNIKPEKLSHFITTVDKFIQLQEELCRPTVTAGPIDEVLQCLYTERRRRYIEAVARAVSAAESTAEPTEDSDSPISPLLKTGL